MASVTGETADGSPFTKRVGARTARFVVRQPVRTIDLAGLSDAPSCTYLELSTEPIPELDLAPLRGHPGLEQVSLALAGRPELAPLAACPALRTLSLRFSGAAPVALDGLAASRLESLSLWFDGAASVDLAPLAGLRLKHVTLGGTLAALDLEPLSGQPLASVTVQCGPLTEIALHPVCGPDLEYLCVSHTAIEELVLLALARCPRLHTLRLYPGEMRWVDVSGIARLEALTQLELPNHKSLFLEVPRDEIVCPGLLRYVR